MTYPRPLSDESAQQAQAAFGAGAGVCQLCHQQIWRYATSSNPDRLTMFLEADGGSWDFPASDKTYPVARFVGRGRGCLTHHNCIEDAS